MNKNSAPLFIGVFFSFIAIWLLNDYLLVDKCLENGGTFNYNKAECLLDNGEIKVSELGNYMMAVYFFMGISISLIVSFAIRKVFNIAQ